MKSTPRGILFLGIGIVCCRADAAQAGTVNSPWPPSSRASCLHRVVKSELIFEQVEVSVLLWPGQLGCKGSLQSAPRPAFVPWLRAGHSLGTCWGHTHGADHVLGSASPADSCTGHCRARLRVVPAPRTGQQEMPPPVLLVPFLQREGAPHRLI